MQSVKKMIERDILLQEKLIERYERALQELPGMQSGRFRA